MLPAYKFAYMCNFLKKSHKGGAGLIAKLSSSQHLIFFFSSLHYYLQRILQSLFNYRNVPYRYFGYIIKHRIIYPNIIEFVIG